MGRVISSVSFSLFSLDMLPPGRDKTLARPSRVPPPRTLPVCFFFHSLSRHCEAREGTLVLRGGRQGRQMSFQTSLPRLLCVSCGSGVRFWKHMHMREAGGGANIISGGLFGPKSSTATVPRKKRRKRGSLQKIYKGTFRWGRCRPPRDKKSEWAWRLIYFQQFGKCLAAHCPAPGGSWAAIPHEATDSKDSLGGPANATPAT